MQRMEDLDEVEIFSNSSDNDMPEVVDGGILMRIAILIDSITYGCLKESVRWFMDTARFRVSISFEDIMMMLTVFVLFEHNLRIIFASKDTDPGFEVATSICIFMFIVELIMQSWAKSTIISFYPPKIEGYVFSFFFFLDILIIVSLFPDIQWIANGMGMSTGYSSLSANVNFLTQAGRVVRTIRLVRLVKIFKNYYERHRQYRAHCDEVLIQNYMLRNRYGHDTPNGKNFIKYSDFEYQERRQSRVGAELSEQTTQRVILIVLAMLCLVPILAYSETNNEFDYSVHLLHLFNVQGDDKSLAAMIADYQSNTAIIKLLLIHNTTTLVNYQDTAAINNLRESVILRTSQSTIDGSVSHVTTIWFNVSSLAQMDAQYGIYLTLFVSVMLLAGSFVFTSDAQRLVLDPIERMVKMVEAMAKDPLHPVQVLHSEGSGEYETRLLENTIEKITGLLRVGFGEAGAGIISSNLKMNDNTSVIDPLIPGKRVYAIFGFCDIHSFEEINEQLGKDVMSFVNTIAEIVHSNVHNWAGNSNKNLGNAFVVVWRLGDEQTLLSISTQNALGVLHKLTADQTDAKNNNGSGDTGPGHRKNSQEKNLPSRNSATDLASKRGGRNLMQFLSAGIGEEKEPASDTPPATATAGRPNRRDSNLGKEFDNGAGGNKESADSKFEGLRRGSLVDLRRVPGAEIFADKALISYLKIIVEKNRSRHIAAYRFDQRLLKDNIKEFRLKMGFGLHAGWAIEGAVGSLQKVDATYLSPHVNMAARLESASRQYSVPLLFSQVFFEILSPHAQRYCRRLDVITVKGSAHPTGIYTYDVRQDIPFKETKRRRKQSGNTRDDRMMEENALTPNDPGYFNASHDTAEVFEKDVDLLQLRSHISDTFLDCFKTGMTSYIQGDWNAARTWLEKANTLMSEIQGLSGDGPSMTILNFMATYNFRAPSDWKGYRHLTAK